MQYSAEWERINDNTWRMETPGGWLVKTVEFSHLQQIYGGGVVPSMPISCSMAYVPDPDMAWMVKKS